LADQETRCVYFQKAGPDNTERTLLLGEERARQLGIRHVVVASTSGRTGAMAASMLAGYNLVVVGHSTGFARPNEQEMVPAHRASIEAAGGHVLIAQHALGGVARAVRRKLGTYQLDEVAAFVLRNFGEGTKVGCEITLMATDAGLVPAGEEILAIGGTGRGADTASIILAANAQDFFDLRVLETICKPRLGR
jgi:uncharacterized protein